MNQIYARQTVSVTELKRSFASVMNRAGDAPVAVLNNNKPEAYLIPAEAYERLMEYIEDLKDAEVVRQRAGEQGVAVNIEDLLNGKNI